MFNLNSKHDNIACVTEGNNINSAEQSKEEFSCDMCDFVSNWANGLTIHMKRTHARIKQLDGYDDVEESDKYF